MLCNCKHSAFSVAFVVSSFVTPTGDAGDAETSEIFISERRIMNKTKKLCNKTTKQNKNKRKRVERESDDDECNTLFAHLPEKGGILMIIIGLGQQLINFFLFILTDLTNYSGFLF